MVRVKDLLEHFTVNTYLAKYSRREESISIGAHCISVGKYWMHMKAYRKLKIIV